MKTRMEKWEPARYQEPQKKDYVPANARGRVNLEVSGVLGDLG
jgi:hypothetical protein